MRKQNIVIFWVAVLLSCVDGCGVTQHNVIAHKALGWFDPAEQVDEDFAIFLSILTQNQDAFQNGAAFPDWGYVGIYVVL
ncbi:MAG: hypothetical protein NXI00_22960 [Cytophagales bacterium]|nr:hypothetical protein [Cytophagales bacterium]